MTEDERRTPAEQIAAEMLGMTAYRAYGNTTGWLTHDGRPMPSWAELSPATREAWRAAANTVSLNTTRDEPTAIHEPVDVLPEWPRSERIAEQLARASTFEQIAQQLTHAMAGTSRPRAWAAAFVRRCAEIRGDDIHTIASERLASRIRKARDQRDEARRELAEMTNSRNAERRAREADDRRITELERQLTEAARAIDPAALAEAIWDTTAARCGGCRWECTTPEKREAAEYEAEDILAKLAEVAPKAVAPALPTPEARELAQLLIAELAASGVCIPANTDHAGRQLVAHALRQALAKLADRSETPERVMWGDCVCYPCFARYDHDACDGGWCTCSHKLGERKPVSPS